MPSAPSRSPSPPPAREPALRAVLVGLGARGGGQRGGRGGRGAYRGGAWLAVLAEAEATGAALVGIRDDEPNRFLGGLGALARAGTAARAADLGEAPASRPDLVVDAGGPSTRFAAIRPALLAGAHRTRTLRAEIRADRRSPEPPIARPVLRGPTLHALDAARAILGAEAHARPAMADGPLFVPSANLRAAGPSARRAFRATDPCYLHDAAPTHPSRPRPGRPREPAAVP